MKKLLCLLLVIFVGLSAVIASGCDKDASLHTIFLTSENQRIGYTDGGGTYASGNKVKITATPRNTENNFIAWIKEGKIVSYDNPYEFVASKNTEGKYTAVFENEDLELIALKELSYTEDLTGANIVQIVSFKLYLDNKEYFQPEIYARTEADNDGLDESISMNIVNLQAQIDPYYIFNKNDTLYGYLEITYRFETTLNKNPETKSKIVNIGNLDENLTKTVEVNNFIASSPKASVTFSFATIEKPIIE